jgi:histone H3/H4
MSLAKNAEELGRKSSRLSVANEDALRQASIRRSTRDPSAALLERNDVQRLLKRIRQNSRETLVLKIKDQILADVNDVVFEAIIQALWKNTNCQVWLCVMYVENTKAYWTTAATTIQF